MQILLLFLFFLFDHYYLHANTIPTVLVSVAPHKFFVEKIAKNHVSVYLMVPAGASSHTYEPTPRQMILASKGEIWFCIGETFEKRAIQALLSHKPSLKIIDLKQGLDLIPSNHHGHHCSCCKGSDDLHFWLSTRQAKIQAETIAKTLSNAYPHDAEFFQTNLKIFTKELDDLDTQIDSILSPLNNRNIFVSHPAYAYFCRDYNLNQYAIEVEGKDPSPQQMTKLLNLAKQLKLETIFIQMQYNNKAAKLVADTLGAKLAILDPYAEQYFKSMLEIAHAFSNK